MPENTPTTEALRAELRRRTEVVVPEAPTASVIERAATVRRTRTRRGLALVAASVAVVVGVGVGIALTTGPGDHAGPSDKPSRVPSKNPRTLEDLPVGKPSEFPFLMGRTVYQGGSSYDLDRRPDRMDTTGIPVVQFPDGSASIVDVAGGRSKQIAGPGSVDGWVVGGHNGQLAWVDGTKVVVVTPSFDGQDEKTVQPFPVHPACCDNPFQVYGITHTNQLVAGTPSDGTFTWLTRGDGLDSPFSFTGVPVKLTGVGDASVYAVTGQEIVMASSGGGGLDIGQADEGRGFVLNETVDAYAGDFDEGFMYLYEDRGAGTWIADRTRTYHGIGTGPSDVRPERRVQLRLPPDTVYEGVHWETDQSSGHATHVVLDVPSEDGTARGAQVRCDVYSGACEIAQWFDPKTIGPRDADAG